MPLVEYQCPNCGAGRRSDGYNRDGWFWLECERRYHPPTSLYYERWSPVTDRCRLRALKNGLRRAHIEMLSIQSKIEIMIEAGDGGPKDIQRYLDINNQLIHAISLVQKLLS